MSEQTNEPTPGEAAEKAKPAKPLPKKPAEAAAKAETPAKPAAPAKKPAGKKTDEVRRTFLGLGFLSWAWITFSATMTAWTLGAARFLFPNVLAEPPSQFTTGLPKDQFEGVNTNWVNQYQCWLVMLKEEKKLIALSTICTHLGCTPSWLEQDQKFKCPCHGSGFYITGINFEGPAPRPLERFAIREIDGLVAVDKSKKFQFELGQWDNPEAFIRLV